MSRPFSRYEMMYLGRWRPVAYMYDGAKRELSSPAHVAVVSLWMEEFKAYDVVEAKCAEIFTSDDRDLSHVTWEAEDQVRFRMPD